MSSDWMDNRSPWSASCPKTFNCCGRAMPGLCTPTAARPALRAVHPLQVRRTAETERHAGRRERGRFGRGGGPGPRVPRHQQGTRRPARTLARCHHRRRAPPAPRYSSSGSSASCSPFAAPTSPTCCWRAPPFARVSWPSVPPSVPDAGRVVRQLRHRVPRALRSSECPGRRGRRGDSDPSRPSLIPRRAAPRCRHPDLRCAGDCLLRRSRSPGRGRCSAWRRRGRPPSSRRLRRLASEQSDRDGPRRQTPQPAGREEKSRRRSSCCAGPDCCCARSWP